MAVWRVVTWQMNLNKVVPGGLWPLCSHILVHFLPLHNRRYWLNTIKQICSVGNFIKTLEKPWFSNTQHIINRLFPWCSHEWMNVPRFCHHILTTCVSMMCLPHKQRSTMRVVNNYGRGGGWGEIGGSEIFWRT